MITRTLRAVLALVGVSDSGRCRCGHPRDAHEHYRPGAECSQPMRTLDDDLRSWIPVRLCSCPRYRPTWRFRR